MGKLLGMAQKPIRWHEAKTKRDLERLYKSLIPELRQVARKSGYALGVHGSLRRDLDLIAVPWIEKSVSPDLLARRLQIAACGLWERKPHWVQKPRGRIACSLVIGVKAYIDLSVAPLGEDE